MPGRAERQLAKEIDAHLALLEEDFRRRGLPPEEARAAARRAFGGVEQAKELHRDARSFMTLDDLRRDVGYALRTLRRTPGFTAVAIVTLALGIGSVAVIYSVIHNVLLEPFPYPHSRRMVDVVVRDGSNNILRGALPVPEFLDYQEQSDGVRGRHGHHVEPMHFVTDAGAERLDVGWMTPNGFSFLGVAPLLGRVFGPADAAPGAPLVAVHEPSDVDDALRRRPGDRRSAARSSEWRAADDHRRHAAAVRMARRRPVDSRAAESNGPAADRTVALVPGPAASRA